MDLNTSNLRTDIIKVLYFFGELINEVKECGGRNKKELADSIKDKREKSINILNKYLDLFDIKALNQLLNKEEVQKNIFNDTSLLNILKSLNCEDLVFYYSIGSVFETIEKSNRLLIYDEHDDPLLIDLRTNHIVTVDSEVVIRNINNYTVGVNLDFIYFYKYLGKLDGSFPNIIT